MADSARCRDSTDTNRASEPSHADSFESTRDEAMASGNMSSTQKTTAVDDIEPDESLEREEYVSKDKQHTLAELDKVRTPIPRVVMHLQRVRSPDYFRTQYLSNLGIWTSSQNVKHPVWRGGGGGGYRRQPRKDRSGEKQKPDPPPAEEQKQKQETSQSPEVISAITAAAATGGSSRPLSARSLVPPRRLSTDGQVKASSAIMRSPKLTTRSSHAAERSAQLRRNVVKPGSVPPDASQATAVAVCAGTEVGTVKAEAIPGAKGSESRSSIRPAPIEASELSASLTAPVECLAQGCDDLDLDGYTTVEVGAKVGERVANAARFEDTVEGSQQGADRPSPVATATAIAMATTAAKLPSSSLQSRKQNEQENDGSSRFLSASRRTAASTACSTESIEGRSAICAIVGDTKSTQPDGSQEGAKHEQSAASTAVAAKTSAAPVAAAVKLLTDDYKITAQPAAVEYAEATSVESTHDAVGGRGGKDRENAATADVPAIAVRPAGFSAVMPLVAHLGDTEENVDTTENEEEFVRGRASTVPLTRSGLGSSDCQVETPTPAPATVDSTSTSGVQATSANPGSPLLMPEKPPRRDIRRDYLTNLGMKRAAVEGPGGMRAAPPMIRRSSFHLDSVDHPVEEELKDPNGKEITFEDLIKVVGSILKGGGGKIEREAPRRICQACKRESGSRGSPQGLRRGKGVASGDKVTPCPHKHVEFAPLVSAVYIPVHSEYSNRVRRSYWNSAGEIREMVYRNMIEFDAEEYNWEKVAEEEDMFYCEETHEFIHPIFFESEEQAAEHNHDEELKDDKDRLEYVNEGRKMPVMRRR